MTVLSDYVARMVEGGMDQDEAMQIAAELFAAGVASAAHRPSSGALRTRKWRENKGVTKRHETSQRDTQSAMSESVTNRHKASQSVTSDNTPLSSSKIDLRKRGERLSPNWSPSDADRAFAKQLGWSDAQIDSEAANFRDYWIAKPGAGGCKLDWPATWRKWVRSSKVKPAGIAATAMSSFSTSADIDWRNVLTFYKKTGHWTKNAGPDPDSLACRAPPELLREFGLLKSA